MAVCNTVVVAKKPHHDKMNDVGQIENSNAECSVQITEAADCDVNASADQDPSSSIDSALCSFSSTAHIVPPALTSTPVVTSNVVEAINMTPKRPGSLFSFTGTRAVSCQICSLLHFPIFCYAGRPSSRYRPSSQLAQQQNIQRPLSPIDSSAETTPSESPAPPQRPRFLQLPGLASAHSFFLLRRSSTPSSDISQAATPILERKQLYEAESPDELSLVDAACIYNIRLLQRSVHHVVVSLPGNSKLSDALPRTQL